jgi:REP element-mobilizing transposase RayT
MFMTTSKKRFFQGSAYHIYNRGNHREHVFKDNDDRKFFLAKVDEYCERDRISILAYCLMDNHFHLLLRQNGTAKLAGMMRSLLTSYAKHSNWKHGLVGHLFQGPYQSRWMNSEEGLAYASRYIHLNPVKVADTRAYRWSSYRQYLGKVSGIADPVPVLELFESKDNYATFVESGPTPEIGRRDGKFFVAQGGSARGMAVGNPQGVLS